MVALDNRVVVPPLCLRCGFLLCTFAAKVLALRLLGSAHGSEQHFPPHSNHLSAERSADDVTEVLPLCASAQHDNVAILLNRLPLLCVVIFQVYSVPHLCAGLANPVDLDEAKPRALVLRRRRTLRRCVLFGD